MRTCDYLPTWLTNIIRWLIHKLTKDRTTRHQVARSSDVSLLETQGTNPQKELVIIKFQLPGSVELQYARRCGATAWAMYIFISSFQKFLRISKVRILTGGRTMNWNWNISFDPYARSRDGGIYAKTDIWSVGHIFRRRILFYQHVRHPT